MRVYNYASFAKVISEGIIKPNMTKVAKILFTPIIDLGKCVNRNGEPYCIDNKAASLWSKQEADIPKNLKKAADDRHVFNGIGKYFSDEILDKVLIGVKVDEVISDLIDLIKDSDLPVTQKKDLKKLYEDSDLGGFLGRAFLFAILQDNTKKDILRKVPETTVSDINDEVEVFNRLIKKIKKPAPLSPPSTIAADEMKYVTELFHVYQEKTGVKCECVEDLDSCPKMKRNFNRQRKNFYLAETIRRGLRDTVSPQENENFDTVKEEMYEGVVTTEEKDYECGFDRMTAVMEHATVVELSSNLKLLTLNWIGPGEKKGICHMLVNDEKLSWMGDD